MAAMASMVQDVWLGWEPRLRALRLAPWDEPRVRLVFHLDAGVTLDDDRLATFLEAMAERLEVIAWEPRGQGASGGRFGPEVLDDARRLVRLLAGIPAKINLIPFNPWPGAPYECSDWEQIERFAEVVNRAGYASPVRTPRGRDIHAACGQLRSASVKLRASERKAGAEDTASGGGA